VQGGFCCVGIGSIWSFTQDQQPIAGLDLIPRGPRRIELVPDSNVWTRLDLMLAVYAFGRILEDRGAEVSMVILTLDAQGNRRGLDDYPNASVSSQNGVFPGRVKSNPGRFQCGGYSNGR